MVNITNTTQLDIFELVRSILRTNSTISSKFKTTDFYEFEENAKARNVRFPQIIIKAPSTEEILGTMPNPSQVKEFTGEVILKIDWDARSKFRLYANAMIAALEAGDATLQASGYKQARLNLVDNGSEIEDEKQIVRGDFELVVVGGVDR